MAVFRQTIFITPLCLLHAYFEEVKNSKVSYYPEEMIMRIMSLNRKVD